MDVDLGWTGCGHRGVNFQNRKSWRRRDAADCLDPFHVFHSPSVSRMYADPISGLLLFVVALFEDEG